MKIDKDLASWCYQVPAKKVLAPKAINVDMISTSRDDAQLQKSSKSKRQGKLTKRSLVLSGQFPNTQDLGSDVSFFGSIFGTLVILVRLS